MHHIFPNIKACHIKFFHFYCVFCLILLNSVMRLFLISGALAILLLNPGFISNDINGQLSGDQIIESKVLNYQLQYRVYTPPNYNKSSSYPAFYVTDGQWYLSEGKMDKTVDDLIVSKKIDPIIIVFIDNRDPKNLRNIRRNNQFLCNHQYLEFVKSELIPRVQQNYAVKENKSDRGIMGMSFGGLNAGYFGLNGSETFGMIAMQSPAFHPCPDIYKGYEKEVLPIKIFMSTGTVNDTEKGSRELRGILEKKGYDYKYMEVKEGHDWDNWRPLIDDVMLYFFGTI